MQYTRAFLSNALFWWLRSPEGSTEEGEWWERVQFWRDRLELKNITEEANREEAIHA